VHKLIVDRIEGVYAFCEAKDGQILDLLLTDLPKELKEGDVLELKEGVCRILIDETEERKNYIEVKTNHLFIN